LTLPGQCAAAIVRLRLAQKGEYAHHYTLSEDAPDRTACLFERIKNRIYPPREQVALEELLPEHDPSTHSIYLIDSGLYYGSERDDLLQWGRVTVIDGGDITSVCSNAWSMMFGHRPVPLAVQLLDRYAVGNLKDDGSFWREEVIPFSLALQSVNINPSFEDGWNEWLKHFDSLANNHTRKREQEGLVILRYLTATGGSVL
jgi:hypothetical protein